MKEQIKELRNYFAQKSGYSDWDDLMGQCADGADMLNLEFTEFAINKLSHPPQTDLLRKAKDLIHVQFISTPLGNAESWEVFIKIEPTLIEIEQALNKKG